MNKIFCEICKELTEYDNGGHFVRYHLNKIHSKSPQEYYDLFFKKDENDICKNPNCSNQTKFLSLEKGYQTYCSNRCTQSDPDFKKNREDTYLSKTGYKHPRQNPEIQKQIEDETLKKTGYRNFFESPDFKKKRKQKLKEKYGTEEYFDSPEFKKYFEENKAELYKKSRISILKKYGVDNIMKLKDVLEKRNQNNLKFYGVENVFELPEIKELIKNTNLLKYGFENHNSNDKQRQKKREYYQSLSQDQKDKLRNKIVQSKYEGFLNIINPIFNQGYELLSYDVRDRHLLKCPLNHEFRIQGQLLIDRVRRPEIICSECNPIIKPFSLMEKELFQFVKENWNDTVLENVFGLVDERMELDIYIPTLKLGFEFNGLFWHNENNKGRVYHKNKTDLYENEGIKVIHIYEDDWNVKNDIVKSRILNLLGKSQNVVYARKCQIKEVDYKEAEIFLNTNHTQGNCVSKFRFGLYYENQLVSLMTFGKPRRGMGYINVENKYELLRFCNKLNTNVGGGASRLFHHFIKNNAFEEIISYADRSWSQGNLYEKLGFSFVKKTQPNYWYINNGIRESRFKYQKSNLNKNPNNKDKTEDMITKEMGLYRIFDSGSLLFRYTK